MHSCLLHIKMVIDGFFTYCNIIRSFIVQLFFIVIRNFHLCRQMVPKIYAGGSKQFFYNVDISVLSQT